MDSIHYVRRPYQRTVVNVSADGRFLVYLALVQNSLVNVAVNGQLCLSSDLPQSPTTDETHEIHRRSHCSHLPLQTINAYNSWSNIP